MAAACGSPGAGGTTATPGAIALDIATASVTIAQGSSTTIVVTVTRSGGFTGAPSIAVDSGPPGVSATLVDSTTRGDVVSGTVRVTVPAIVAPGSYTVRLRASGQNVTSATASFGLVVITPPPQTFTVRLSATALSVTQGAADSSLQLLLDRSNFAGAVTLAVDNTPVGVTASFGAAPTTGTALAVVFTVAPTVALGSYTLVLRGTAAGVGDRTATLVLTVAPAGHYALSVTPPAITLQQGASTAPVINLDRSNYGESVALLAEHVPAGLTAAILPGTTAGPAVSLSLTAADQLPVGVDTVLIRGVAPGLADQVAPLVVTVVPPGPSAITVVGGNNQSAMADDPLRDSVRVRVTDQAGRAVAGAAVVFAVTSGEGTVSADTVPTSASGTASAAWTLGPDLGQQQLTMTVAGISANAVAVASGCDPVSCAASLAIDNRQWMPFSITTYDGSNQVVHPDITWGGPGRWRWMAITPYPGGDAAYENPSIYQSRNGHVWRAPSGLGNPVASPGSAGYLSDPDISVDTATATLWMYYRQVYLVQNIIWLTRSTDGAHWSKPVQVLVVPSHQAVSPAVVRGAPQAPWIMWVVNAGPNGCQAASTTVERRVSTDGVTWEPPAATDLAEPGLVIWHIDVQWVAARNEFWAVYNTYASGLSCSTNELHFARSADGMHWTTYPGAIATAGVIPEFGAIVYRSTFLPNSAGDTIRIWASGARLVQNSYIWSAAHATFRVDDFLATLQAGVRAPLDRNARIGLPMPEPQDSGK